ncbi:HK97 gp10 family phage protein [Atopobium fossor]|uniref:HK97 gp10 family phage protein n=1 Tax=Atopobium fossor TaxID=39487 RepID=UPI0003F52C37|nr:HK97 gp10 family phage protein [Atopobium fossor]
MSDSRVSISIDGFADVLMQEVEHTAQQNIDALRKNVRRAARATADELRNGALTPAMTGKYAAGWSATTEEVDGHIKVVVHNKKKPGLTHLLEKGHEKFIHGRDTGTRVRAYPHIEPAYAVGAEKLRSD